MKSRFLAITRQDMHTGVYHSVLRLNILFTQKEHTLLQQVKPRYTFTTLSVLQDACSNSQLFCFTSRETLRTIASLCLRKQR